MNEEKITLTKSEFEKKERSAGWKGVLILGIPTVIFGIQNLVSFIDTNNRLVDSYSDYHILFTQHQKQTMEYDSLKQVFDKNNFYLQTKKGIFVPYDVAKQQRYDSTNRANLESYQAKIDSIDAIMHK
jgi:hypothetical protein